MTLPELLLIVLAVWGIVALAWTLGGILAYWSSEYASTRRMAARLAILSPFWPGIAVVWAAPAVWAFLTDGGAIVARFFRTADLPDLFRKARP